MQEMAWKTRKDKDGKSHVCIVYADTGETQYERIQRLRKQYE